MMRRAMLLALSALLTTGCFHQVVRTGATPGPRVVERPWTATWIFGLVAADVINASSECPNGVAIVETRQTFANGLVGLLTLGIFTPQAVSITCASGQQVPDGLEVVVASGASDADRERAAQQALDLAKLSGDPVMLRYLP